MIAADLGGVRHCCDDPLNPPTHNLRDQETRRLAVPVGGASETGEMNETGEVLSREPFPGHFHDRGSLEGLQRP